MPSAVNQGNCPCGGGDVAGCNPCPDGIPRTLFGTFSGPGKPDFHVVFTYTGGSGGCRWDVPCAYYPEPDLAFSLNGSPPTGGLGALVYVDDCDSDVLSDFVFGDVIEGVCAPFYYEMGITGFVTLWARGWDTLVITA